MTKTNLSRLALSTVGALGLTVMACAGDGAPPPANNGTGTTGTGTTGTGTTGTGTTGTGTTGTGTTGTGTTGTGTTGTGTTGTGTTGTGTTGGTAVSGISVMNGYAMGGGFKGYWYTYKDAGGSTISPACDSTGLQTCFMNAGASICVSGSGAKVTAMEYAKYWGAGVGWNLNQGIMPPNPAMGASLSGKTKVSVNVQMKTPSPLRLKFKVAGDPADYCANLQSGANNIPLSMITKECWTPGGAMLPTSAQIEAIQFQVPTNETAATAFDFCIASLSID